jgi:hypothetical protein
MCVLFSNMSPERYIDGLPKPGHPAVDEDIKLNILLAMKENSHNNVRQIGRDYDIPFTSVHTELKLEE